jgi:hypothetical protein
MTTFLLIGLGVVVVLLVIGVFVSATSERSLVEDRLGKYLEEDLPKNQGREKGKTALTGQ